MPVALQAALVVFGIAAALTFILGPVLWLMEDHGWLALLWATVAIAAVAAVTFGIWASPDGQPDGVHRWRGGTGPATVCRYTVENETVMVGKVPVAQTAVYTECRDGPR